MGICSDGSPIRLNLFEHIGVNIVYLLFHVISIFFLKVAGKVCKEHHRYGQEKSVVRHDRRGEQSQEEA